MDARQMARVFPWRIGPCRAFVAARSWFELSGAVLLATVSFAAAAQGQTESPASRPATSATAQQARAAGALATDLRRNASASAVVSLDAAFRRADRNNDGRLSRQEADHFPMLAERFDQIDADQDRQLSRDEFQRAAQD